MNGSWNAYLASPADLAGTDDIIINLAKERESGIEVIERTPKSLITSSRRRRRSSSRWRRGVLINERSWFKLNRKLYLLYLRCFRFRSRIGY